MRVERMHGMEQDPRNSHDRARNRRDIGQVEFLSERITAARELSSCCVGVEAMLDSSYSFANILKLWRR